MGLSDGCRRAGCCRTSTDCAVNASAPTSLPPQHATLSAAGMPLVSLRDVVVHAGYVEKLPVSMRGLGAWRRRFLVLRKGQLDWFEHETHAEVAFAEELDLTAADRPPNGTLTLDETAVVDRGTAGCLGVRTSRATLWIRTTQPELVKWATQIEEAIVRPDTLYADSFVQIVSTGVILKNYYWPSCGSRQVPLSSIVGVDLRPEDRVTAMRWGLGMGGVWWARDQRLSRANGAVVVKSDSMFKHGFSCDKRDDFVAVLQQVNLACHPAFPTRPTCVITFAGAGRGARQRRRARRVARRPVSDKRPARRSARCHLVAGRDRVATNCVRAKRFPDTIDGVMRMAWRVGERGLHPSRTPNAPRGCCGTAPVNCLRAC